MRLRWGSGVVLACGLLLALPALAETKAFDPVAATDAYLASVPADAKA